jgi:4'-phosphopantetheinyl transferase EntD
MRHPAMPPLRAILPAVVTVAEGSTDPHPAGGPLPAEAPLVWRAVPKRRREFATGRALARAALRDLGLPAAHTTPILAGPRRQPLWPPGVVGSITHTDGYCAAAVAWSRDLTALGIDAEPHQPLDEPVAALVCGPAERRWCAEAGVGTAAAGRRARLLFSIKESVFKAVWPLTGADLGFGDVAVTVDPDRRAWRASPAGRRGQAIAAVLAALDGALTTHGTVEGSHLLTAAWIRARGSGPAASRLRQAAADQRDPVTDGE